MCTSKCQYPPSDRIKPRTHPKRKKDKISISLQPVVYVSPGKLIKDRTTSGP